MNEPPTISTIIAEAGGPSSIERLAIASNAKISRDAVYKWAKTGIPDRHWSIILALTAYGADDLYRANCAARRKGEVVDQTILPESAQ
ncbi:carph-isopro domain-containing protein [Rhizobium halophytocola]|uniref:Transcriptional regulator n=1 Tax=Rhizobium halophytocola TaxID=735519 RepID=A0ABS4E2J4_9HYPH|nr:hypothetical protein [Rhizobium halophytocola]MBP1852141.1 hypothetical protein [Rhizobium halophytocola]